MRLINKEFKMQSNTVKNVNVDPETTKLISNQAKQISDLTATINKENIAHAATRNLAGQHIGALRVQLASCKCPGVKPENTPPAFDWETTAAATEK
jgi:hypothetical protein